MTTSMVYSITIESRRAPYPARTTRVRAESASEALAKGVVKLYGRRTFVEGGQVFRHDPPSGNGWRATAVTGQVHVAVERAAKATAD
jgi:hypothetical protein